MHTIDDLPAPENDALAKSDALSEVIKQHMAAAGGHLSFADFMQLALYHPTLGYYQSPQFDIGSKGDFTTAPEISPLFAYCFAEQVRQVFLEMGKADILELGAGTGRFAYDLLSRLDQLNCSPNHYYIYEPSIALRQKQKKLLASLSSVIWLTELPTELNGVIIANEVLDALPVHCVQWQTDDVYEKQVIWQNNQFAWQLVIPANEALLMRAEALGRQYHLSNGYASEINLSAETLVTQVAQLLNRGVILFADYGYGQREYYHPQRYQGSLTCFYKHLHHNNPLLYPGLQDITAHVDFTRVIEVAADFGCSLAGFTTQSSFLLGSGLVAIIAEAEQHLSAAEKVNFHHAIKQLTMPTEMGERIKIMGLAKNIEQPLSGFALLDRGRDL